MGLTTLLAEFTDKQGRIKNSYVSNVLDEQFIKLVFLTKFNVVLSSSVMVRAEDNTLQIIGGSWEDYGVTVGCTMSGTITPVDGGSSVFTTVLVTHVEEDYIVLDLDTPLTPRDFNGGQLIFDVNPQGFEILVNLVQSTENGNEFSLIDGTASRFVVEGIDTLTELGSVLAFEEVGDLSGGCIISPTIGRNADYYNSLDEASYKVYQVNIPTFTNYLYNNPEYFAGTDCVKLWIQASVIPVILNPAIKMSTIYTTSTGNTGYLNESFNGYDTEYSIESVDLFVGGLPAPDVDPTATTNFQVKVNGPFNDDSKYGIAFWHTISIDDDHFFNAHYENNTMLCKTEAISAGGSPDIVGSLNSLGAGVVIEDVIISETGAQATFTGKIVPNTEFTTEILGKSEGNRGYKLAVKVEDPELDEDYIRPIWLTAAEGQMTKFVPPLGPWLEAFGYTVTTHGGDLTGYAPGEAAGIPTLVPIGIITEDDVLVDLHLRVPRPSYQLTTGETFTGFSVSIVAQKFTGETFELEPGIDINFSDYDIIGDAVEVDYTFPRGFKLPPASDRNAITVERYPSDDNANFYGLSIKYGLLMDWRYWLSQANADSDFNGEKNKDWFHYQTGEWTVALLFELHTPDGSYVNDVNLQHESYDQWLGKSTLEFYRLDGTQVNVPIEGEITRVLARHRLPTGWGWITPSVWGMITNEPFESQFRWTTSTVLPDGGIVQNPFSPLAGQVGARLTFVSSGLPGTVANDTAVIEEYWDPSKTSYQNGSSFTARINGRARKGTDQENFWNRLKETVMPVKIPSPETVERLLKECCEFRKVIGDTVSQEKKYNDVTSHCVSGENVTFTLLKGSAPSGYAVDSTPVPNSNGWHSCTLSWHHIIQAAGPGCYNLMANVESAGIEISFKVEAYELFPATKTKPDGTVVPHDNTLGDVCVTGLFNFNDIKNGLDMTDSGIVDSVRIKGVFGRYQPNTQIDNELDGRYRKQKVVRQNDDEYTLKTAPISGKFMRLLLYILLHENECWVTDYNPYNIEYYREVNVIVSETPTLNHEQYISRKVPVSVKFKDKLSNSISSYNNRNASKVPTTITIGGNVTIEGGTVMNSDGSYTEDFTGPTFVLPDTTVNIYEMVDGVPVLVDTFTHPTLEPATNITIDL